MLRGRLDDNIDIMDAQRYDISKRNRSCNNLQIQTGIVGPSECQRRSLLWSPSPTSPVAPPNTPSAILENEQNSEAPTTLELPPDILIVALAPDEGEGDQLLSPGSQTLLEPDHAYHAEEPPENEDDEILQPFLKSEPIDLGFDDDFGTIRQVDVIDRGDFIITRTIVRPMPSYNPNIQCNFARPASTIASTISRILSNPCSRSPSPDPSVLSRPSSPVRPPSPLALDLNFNFSTLSLGCIPPMDSSTSAERKADAVIEDMLECAARPLANLELQVVQTTSSSNEELWRGPIQEVLYGPECRCACRKQTRWTLTRLRGTVRV